MIKILHRFVIIISLILLFAPGISAAGIIVKEGDSINEQRQDESEALSQIQPTIIENPSPLDNTTIPLGITPALQAIMERNATSTPHYKPGNTFLSVCYHNIEDENPDQSFVGVTTSKLVNELSWFTFNGYHFISIDDILASRRTGKPLPDKAILLTFDDGYVSAYTRVFPILKAFHIPAVFAVVGAWLEKGRPDDVVEYGDKQLHRSAFVTWDQVREMAKSGLVEIASHSYNLHRGILANAQGNFEPAAVTREYNPKTHIYETEKAYEARINADTARIVKKIFAETGKKPRVMVWPYGQYNQVAVDIQARHGMPITLTLDDGFGKVDNLRAVPRYLINADPDIGGFVVEMRELEKDDPIRVVQVDLDYVYDPDPVQEAHNIDELISRIYTMKISTVYLQAFSDPTGSGVAKALYFPNRHLPMRRDLFNRVAWQLLKRAHVDVYAWMPVLSYDFGDSVTKVAAWNPKTNIIEPDKNAYPRISPFDPVGRRKILDIYEDLARDAPIQGMLFHDDATLSDFEDASPPAFAAYVRAGLPASVKEIRANPAFMKKWTDLKVETLIAFTQELAAHIRQYRSPIITARNIYAPVMLEPKSVEWFAQDYGRFLNAYDYTAVEAMPAMENISAGHADEWLKQLVAVAASSPRGLQHTVFELQAVDWRNKKSHEDYKIPTSTLAAQMRLLAKLGALNFGYYPDDFVTDHPNSKALHKDFSIQFYPYLP